MARDSYKSLEIADHFVELAKERKGRITNMQLQKLVYIAHGCRLAIEGKSLVSDPVEAWPFGPVFPELYSKLRKFGKEPIRAVVGEKLTELDSVSEFILDMVYSEHGNKSGWTLSNMTHKPGTAWSIVWSEQGKQFGEITNDLIREDYISKMIANLQSA